MFKNIINKICNLFKKSQPDCVSIKLFFHDLYSDSEDIIIGSARNIIINTDKDDSYPKLSIDRAMFDRLRLSELFLRNFFNKNAQKFPFQIEVENFKNRLMIHNAWLTSSGAQIEFGNTLIVQDLQLEAEYLEYKNI